MKFRLTYEGPLWPTQRDALAQERDKMAPHKQAIRRVFHAQLRQLWQSNKFLRECEMPPNFMLRSPYGSASYYGSGSKVPLREIVANRFPMFGYRFAPLVVEEFSLLCSLDILFLRRDMPGSALHAGDIDNRVKTLIDTLRPPRSQNELVGDDTAPKEGEDPFFCLLEEDKQVSHFSVETDLLLTPGADQRESLVSIPWNCDPITLTCST